MRFEIIFKEKEIGMKVLMGLITSVILICFSTFSWSAGIDDPALVGLWLCDDGEGDLITDSSPNCNDATGTFEWCEGKFGGGILITSGSITVPTSDSVNSAYTAHSMMTVLNMLGLGREDSILWVSAVKSRK